MLTDLIKVSDVDKAIVQQKVSQFLTEAQAIEIVDDDDYQYAAELLIQEKTIYKFIKETYAETKESLNEAKANLMKLIRKDTDPLDQAERIIKGKMGVWHAEQERIRLENLRKHEAELRKQEEERRLNEAVDTGDESMLEEPIILPTPQVQEVPKTKGISYRDIYRCEVIDITKIPLMYLMFNKEKAEKVANATKGEVQIPGVKICKDQVIAARSR